MNKPQGYDEAQAFGEFETLPAGGYKCIIKKVACEKTQAGKEYLKLAIDILEGEFKDFFQKKFDNDTREEKKWSGVWTVFTEGFNPGTTNPKFLLFWKVPTTWVMPLSKTFITFPSFLFPGSA